MMLLGLIAVAAAETPAELESRLLGDAPVVAPASVAPSSSPRAGLLGLGFGLGALGLGVWLWKRETTGGASSSSVRVVGRQSLPGGAVVLLDVDGLDGTVHRLLVGAGGGSPRVLADVSLGLIDLAENGPEDP